MRRLHLFEIEDLPGCPAWLREAITGMLLVIHRWFGTATWLETELAKLIEPGVETCVVDLCSGSGGPMPEAIRRLRQRSGYERVRLCLTDRYPPPNPLRHLRMSTDPDSTSVGSSKLAEFPDWMRYHERPVAAADVVDLASGAREVRSMVCCFHHLPVAEARAILSTVQDLKIPMLIFEMSDNRYPPRWLWWAGLLPNFLFGLAVAAWVRPLTWRHLFFSYLVPVIPASFAWDGTVSNIRTYGEADFEVLVHPIQTPDYQWSTRLLAGRLLQHLVISGVPTGASVADERSRKSAAIKNEAGPVADPASPHQHLAASGSSPPAD